MESAQLFRLREALAALRMPENCTRPVCVRLDAGTIVLVVGDLRPSGLVDVASDRHRFSVFAEDLLAKSERLLAASG